MRIRMYRMSLKARLLSLIVLILIPVILIVSLLFYQTHESLKQKAIEKMEYSLDVVIDNLDALVTDIYNTSAYLATEPKVQNFLFEDYTGDGVLKKRLAAVTLKNKVLRGYDSLRPHQEITAIYTYKGELFNFTDPNHDGEDVISVILGLGVNDKENLSKFCWYPLMDNFLVGSRTGELRRDKIIIGSRRNFSIIKSGYVAVHIFALHESDLYGKYNTLAQEVAGEVYIVNGKGELLSSSCMSAVETGVFPAGLAEYVNEGVSSFEWSHDGKQYVVRVGSSKINDWKTVFAIPEGNVTKEVDTLFVKIVFILSLCLLACCLLIVYLYKSFMEPISAVNSAMEEVYHGNLDAYVDKKSKNEAGNMITYYNAMLRSIHTTMEEKVFMERKKRELEMEVLMNQINPHFLYNTLENIVWKSGEAGRPDIGRIAASLGRLYRLSINKGNLMIQMQQEIEHLMAYINIQKSRYEDAFEMELDFDIDTVRPFYTLKMILQPVVENSFLYGFEGISHVLKIRLVIRVKENHILLRIIDNGCGFDKERLEAVREQIRYGRRNEEEQKGGRKSCGIGLHNISERLTMYFGEENALNIYSRKGMGTMTVLSIPKMTEVIKNL